MLVVVHGWDILLRSSTLVVNRVGYSMRSFLLIRVLVPLTLSIKALAISFSCKSLSSLQFVVK